MDCTAGQKRAGTAHPRQLRTTMAWARRVAFHLLAAFVLVGCAHVGHDRELDVTELRALVLRHMTEHAASLTSGATTGSPFRAEHLEKVDGYAALEKTARMWGGERMAEDFLARLSGADERDNRVYFLYSRSLRNFLYASIRRDGSDIRTAVMPWCR